MKELKIPENRRTERCVQQFSSLIKSFTVFENDNSKALHEARQYAPDNSLLPSGEIGIDDFWAKIEKLGRYVNLCAVMNAAFHNLLRIKNQNIIVSKHLLRCLFNGQRARRLVNRAAPHLIEKGKKVKR